MAGQSATLKQMSAATPTDPSKPKLSSAPAVVATPAMSAGLIVLILSMLLGIQPVTTDLYLPALPALTEGFGASMTQAQLTLSALLLAFGTSQLIWGPLSDRFGRQPPQQDGAPLAARWRLP